MINIRDYYTLDESLIELPIRDYYKIVDHSNYVNKMHTKFLKGNGVKLPKKGKGRCALNYLSINLGKYIHIDDIKKHVGMEHKLTGMDP